MNLIIREKISDFPDQSYQSFELIGLEKGRSKLLLMLMLENNFETITLKVVELSIYQNRLIIFITPS